MSVPGGRGANSGTADDEGFFFKSMALVTRLSPISVAFLLPGLLPAGVLDKDVGGVGETLEGMVEDEGKALLKLDVL